MNLVRNIPTPRRLLLPLLLAIAIATAIAAALVLEPPATSQRSTDSSDGVGVSDGLAGASDGTESSLLLAPRERSEADTSSPVDDAALGGVASKALDESAPAGDAIGVMPETIVGSQPAELGLKILQDAHVTLKVKRGRLDETFAAAASLARRYNGYVVSSTLDNGTRDRSGSAVITIRIPHDRFERALDNLREHGKFTRLEVTSQDVTQEYVDARSRLRHDQAVEARLLKLLGRAESVTDALVIQDRLDAIQQNIEVEKGRINYLDKLTRLSTIELAIVEKGSKAGTSDDSESWGFDEAIDDAAHNFVGNVNRAIVGLGGALPALLLLAVAYVVGRGWWHRREARAAANPPAPAIPAEVTTHAPVDQQD